MGWVIFFAVVLLLTILPLGVFVSYDEDGVLVKIVAGPVKITLFPRPKKEKKSEKKSKKKTSASPAEQLPKPPQPPKQAPEKKKGGSWTDFLPLVQVALDFLGSFRRKLRINQLELKLTMAGDDPCDLAVNYGRAWAAVGNLMPQLERLFVIKKRNIAVACDFTASQTLVKFRSEATITLGRLVSLAVVYGIRVFREFWKIKTKRKGGAGV